VLAPSSVLPAPLVPVVPVLSRVVPQPSGSRRPDVGQRVGRLAVAATGRVGPGLKAAAAARDDRPDDAAELIDAAAAAAARIGDRTRSGEHLMLLGGFETAQVEMMRVEVAAVAGDAVRVLELARRCRWVHLAG